MKTEDFKVELRPHRGIQQTAYGPREVELPQSVVFVNGVWAGYVATEPGSQINLIGSGIPEDVVTFVKAEVDRLRGNVSANIAQATNIEDNDVKVEVVSDLAPPPEEPAESIV